MAEHEDGNPIWDRPIYEEFFRAVRTVNLSLAPQRQIRVLLGDPPLDWEAVRTQEDYRKLTATSRDRFATDLIRREVVEKNRRALLVYGDMHFLRKHSIFNFEPSEAVGGHTIVSLLEESIPPTKVFTIWTSVFADLEKLQGDVVSWARPSLATLRGTTLGSVDFSFYDPAVVRVAVRNGSPDWSTRIPREQWRPLRMEDQFDAVLYLGPPSTLTNARLSPALCADRAFIEMRLQRMTLAGFPQAEGMMKRSCGDQTVK